MKRILVAIPFALAAACGGSDGGPSQTTLALFEGAPWNASVTDTANCPSPIGKQSGTRPYSITFVPGSGSDLQFTSAENCVFKLNVSNNTATLANGPVSCTASFAGVTATITWTSFTASTSDGHTLSINGAGTATSNPVTCPFTETGTATR